MSDQTTTQSKFKKKRKEDIQPSINANEVRIKGNGGHVKRYVDYACSLLDGQRVDPIDKVDDVSSDKKDDDDDQTLAVDNDEEPKKFDTIVLKATGRAINRAVTTAEVVKRRIAGLHQITSLETLEITDVWEPMEQGLKEVETKRRVASITITLSRADDVDKSAAGYQIPLPEDAIKPFSAGTNSRPRGGGMRRNRGGNRGGGGRDRDFNSNRNRNRNRNRGGGGYDNGRQGGRPSYDSYNDQRRRDRQGMRGRGRGGPRGGGYGGGYGGGGYGGNRSPQRSPRGGGGGYRGGRGRGGRGRGGPRGGGGYGGYRDFNDRGGRY